jgi:hypothetical protein
MVKRRLVRGFLGHRCGTRRLGDVQILHVAGDACEFRPDLIVDAADTFEPILNPRDLGGAFFAVANGTTNGRSRGGLHGPSSVRQSHATALCEIAHRDRAVTVERYCPPLWTDES